MKEGASTKNKRDILFLCQFFYPEHNSSATLPFDTAEYLASQGFTVDALCGYPKEYSDALNVPIKETKNGVNIHRIKYLQLKRTKKLGRLINYFSFSMSALLQIARMKKYKCIVVYSNPPVLPFAAVLANMLFKTKIVFVCYDVYPEVAYASNSLKKGGLIDRVMNLINNSVFKRASAVVALTDEMKEFVTKQRKRISPDKIVTISNWAHEEKNESVSSPDYSRFGFESDDFIVSYFGNMGICQETDTLLNTAYYLKDYEKIKFFIAGHGSKKPFIEEFVKKNSLSNVYIDDFLVGDDFSNAVNISSCCVVTLEKGLKGMCAPSKYYSYLKAGRAVLSVTEEGSYLAEEIEREQIGSSVKIGDFKALASQILSLYDNPESLKSSQSRSLSLYNEKYAFNIAMDKYKNLLTKVISDDE